MQSAAQQLPKLTGKTRSQAIAILNDRGFQFTTRTAGGYETFEHPDGSRIHIRPNGEVVRTGPKIRGENGKSYRRRYDPSGNQIQFIPGTNTHQTGEILSL